MEFNFEDLGTESPEFDRMVRIGKEHYHFFFPIEIGEYVVNVWTRTRLFDQSFHWKNEESMNGGLKYSLSIYKNGNQISSNHPCASRWGWSYLLNKSWSQEIFTKDVCVLELLDY